MAPAYDPTSPFKGVKDLVDHNVLSLPSAYIKPFEKRHNPQEVFEGIDLPRVDLQSKTAMEDIKFACEEWGFFELINHGVPEDVIEDMVKNTHTFFNLSTTEKMKYFSEDVFNPMREVTKNYVKNMQILGKKLLIVMSKALGLHENKLQEIYGNEEMIVRLNYYPPCPDPERALGLNPHSDSGGITILWQDQVGGLQIQKEGKWYNVRCNSNALIVNVGDQVEIITNGIFKSVIHRAIVNRNLYRMSMASFFNPCAQAIIAPIQELLDKQNPAQYKARLSKDYIGDIYNKYIEGKNVKRED
ncbi:probable 2-oxoglutarate-dependent dioxygenase ANS [Selaginella moellendorffii]|uniref:probable 2-oxoglutarate-dependent dioxygenase ANS n=1 Tax=Selaginella moellendorffii TaxID=88036 RepID=UPI000D1C8519|nr:probable 2-oxoglutarate-dependent dioxygenase ANS [Selaginella moellendorffii]|eukprot:XP_024544750.1 probable 2-oxoglutarate-dependent dioxygenase ANS [Selaginella moellendorffii]